MLCSSCSGDGDIIIKALYWILNRYKYFIFIGFINHSIRSQFILTTTQIMNWKSSWGYLKLYSYQIFTIIFRIHQAWNSVQSISFYSKFDWLIDLYLLIPNCFCYSANLSTFIDVSQSSLNEWKFFEQIAHELEI